jgi:hypothetical protein
LAIGDDERAERTKTLQCLVAVLLGGVLVNWSIGKRCVGTGDLLRLPDEILEKIALVLCQEEVFSLFDN